MSAEEFLRSTLLGMTTVWIANFCLMSFKDSRIHIQRYFSRCVENSDKIDRQGILNRGILGPLFGFLVVLIVFFAPQRKEEIRPLDQTPALPRPCPLLRSRRRPPHERR